MSNVIRLNGRSAERANGKRVASPAAAQPGVPKANGKPVAARFEDKRVPPQALARARHESDVRQVPAANAGVARPVGKPRAPAGTERADRDPSAPRARREPPARSQPNRSITNAFRPAKSTKKTDDKASAKSAVKDAVEGAYRVVDDYLSWGRDAASNRAQDAPRQDGWGGGSMGRHPYAGMGMYSPIAKWWYDAASYWMGHAAPWYGVPCPDDRDRAYGCQDQGVCGPRSCSCCGPHRQGDGRPASDATQAGQKREIQIVCDEPWMNVSAVSTTLHAPPKDVSKLVVLSDVAIHADAAIEDGILTLRIHEKKPKANEYRIRIENQRDQRVASVHLRVKIPDGK